MSKLTNVLELSLATSITPEVSHARRNQIRALHNPIKKLGALALHDFTTHFPNATANLLGTQILNPDLQYLNQGADAMVFKANESKVVKVGKHGTRLASSELDTMAKHKREQFSTLANYLGPFVISQETVVGQHPYLENRRAILTWQQFCEFTDTRVFTMNETGVNADAIAQIRETYPSVIPQFGEFLDASRELYAAEKLLPDTNGTSNVVINHNPQPNLLLIDGFPIDASNPSGQSLILEQMRSLENTLERVA